jgi:putative sterol carrier protein
VSCPYPARCSKSIWTDLLAPDAFPSSVAFDAINEALSSNDSERKNAVKQGGAVFSFKLKNAAGQEESWFIDLKETGKVGKGDAPQGKKADVTLLLSDENFAKLIAGKSKAQTLFMSGKLKVKGNVMKGTRLSLRSARRDRC